jgi:1-acyl-sn-glycerol-3-phosphate acyltransferase
MVYPIAKLTLGPFIKLWIRKIDGTKNLPKDAGFVVACNHGSYFDDLAIYRAVIPYANKYLHMYVNSSYFKFAILRFLFKWGRCIAIDVDKGKPSGANKKAFKDAIKYLKKGELLGIFPEGHRSYPDKGMREGKTGVARLALAAKVPVVPIGIEGSKKILPKGSRWLRFKRCNIRIGKPLYFEKYYGKGNNKKALKEVTHKIMKSIAKLAKEKYNY